VLLWRYVCLRYAQFISNVPYKRAHMTETTAMSRSWKKPTAISVSVSRLYVTFVVLQPNIRLEWLFVEVPRPHTVRHRHNPVGLLRTSDQHVAEDTAYTTHNKHKTHITMHLSGLEPAIPWSIPLQNYIRYGTPSFLKNPWRKSRN